MNNNRVLIKEEVDFALKLERIEKLAEEFFNKTVTGTLWNEFIDFRYKDWGDTNRFFGNLLLNDKTVKIDIHDIINNENEDYIALYLSNFKMENVLSMVIAKLKDSNFLFNMNSLKKGVLYYGNGAVIMQVDGKYHLVFKCGLEIVFNQE